MSACVNHAARVAGSRTKEHGGALQALAAESEPMAALAARFGRVFHDDLPERMTMSEAVAQAVGFGVLMGLAMGREQ